MFTPSQVYPMLWAGTENRQPIVSKEEYLKASFKLVDNVATRAAGDILNATGEIQDAEIPHGRGKISQRSSLELN